MARPKWFLQLIKTLFPHRISLARMTHLPGVREIVDHMLFAGNDLFYIPDEKVITINQPLATPQSTIVPTRIVEHFIEEASIHWIMNECICRSSSHCQDYPIDLGCLFLGEAALGIDPALGRRVSKQEALDHLQRAREAGLVHLIGRDKLDTVWLDIGPDHKLLTICNCCPCCCLWRILPYVDPVIGSKVTRMPGVHVTVTDRCVGCGQCTRGVCFVEAIHLEDRRAVIDDTLCRGCGRCVEICPQHAIELSITSSQAIEEAITRVAASVDVH